MKILHIGPKNYPPAHGGVEKSVFDIIKYTPNFTSYVFVEWNQTQTEYVKVLPKNIFKQIKLINKFCHENSIDLLHFNKEGFIPLSIIFSVFTNYKVVHSIRGCAWRIKRWNWFYRLMFYTLDILACLFVPYVVFVGNEDYRYFSNIIFWRKLIHIPNGIEINELIASNDNRKCVYIGRISPEKNIINLIEQFSKLKNKKLDIYGPFDKHDPSYKDKIFSLISRYSNVNYKGVISYDEILTTLCKYNTFINLSFSEGMPVSVLEAASVGLNLILSDIPQHRDLGFIDVIYVNPYQPIFEINFEEVSLRNKEHVEMDYSIQNTVMQYSDIYLR